MSKQLSLLREACRRLGVSFITLKGWIYAGKIRAIRSPTGGWMISESEVERIVGGRTEAGEVKAVVYAQVRAPQTREAIWRGGYSI